MQLTSRPQAREQKSAVCRRPLSLSSPLLAKATRRAINIHFSTTTTTTTSCFNPFAANVKRITRAARARAPNEGVKSQAALSRLSARFWHTTFSCKLDDASLAPAATRAVAAAAADYDRTQNSFERTNIVAEMSNESRARPCESGEFAKVSRAQKLCAPQPKVSIISAKPGSKSE